MGSRRCITLQRMEKVLWYNYVSIAVVFLDKDKDSFKKKIPCHKGVESKFLDQLLELKILQSPLR